MSRRVAYAIIITQFVLNLYLGYSAIDLAVWNDDLKQELARIKHDGGS